MQVAPTKYTSDEPDPILWDIMAQKIYRPWALEPNMSLTFRFYVN
jgi:hypothetical protein